MTFFFFKKTIQAWQNFYVSGYSIYIFQYIIAKRFRSRIDHLIFWYCLIYNVYIFFIIIYEPLFVLRNDCNQRKKARFYQASSHAYA